MAPVLNVYDLARKKTAVLQNAYNITETQELNNIYSLTFDLPATDPKAELVRGFHYVRYGEEGQLYRIVKVDPSESDTSILNISCEHVIAVLCDNVMFGAVQYGGTDISTVETINYILSRQDEQRWVLDECDFDFEFEYNWEQENLLNALYSVPKEFVSPYKWVFDTIHFPWRISLKRIDETAKPEYYIRARLNLLSSSSTNDFADICTRLYPLGYGEGVNQLTIKDVNNGVPYLQAPPNVVAQYGIKEKVMVDRSFESADTLKAYAETLLANLQTPSYTRQFDVTDLYPITGKEIDNAEVGKICKLTEDGTITYITKTVRKLDEAGNLQIDLSSKTTDVAATIADLADRVRIESVYSQGATQLYQHSKDANATPDKGMILSLYFPTEMKQINKVLLRMQLKRFRAYSQSTAAGGGSTQTSSGGSTSGSTSQATGAGGFSANVTSSEIWQYADYDYAYTGAASGGTFDTGDSYRMSSETGNAVTNTPTPYSGGEGHYHSFYRPYHHYHSVKINIPALAMNKKQLSHTHNVSLSAGATSHSHSFNIGEHTHSVTIPTHTHAIETGIFESGSPSGFDIYVGGEKKNTDGMIGSTSYNDDITAWLIDSSGTIPRNRWIDIEIRPNDKAYIVTSVFVQGFVQSRGGGNY